MRHNQEDPSRYAYRAMLAQKHYKYRGGRVSCTFTTTLESMTDAYTSLVALWIFTCNRKSRLASEVGARAKTLSDVLLTWAQCPLSACTFFAVHGSGLSPVMMHA